MPYHHRGLSLQAARGDPGFFGSVGRFVGGVAKTAVGVAGQVLPGPAGFVARQVSARIAPRGAAQVRRQSRAMARVQIPFLARGTGRRVIPQVSITGGPGPGVRQGETIVLGAPKRRRMNPLNPKALSRSTRRLAAFTRRVRSVEKQLRKIAPRSRSRPRADLPRGHRHVR